jgi:hypothetical protein
VEASPPGGGGGGGGGGLKTRSSGYRTTSSSSLSTNGGATDAASSSSTLSSDAYMRMVDELVARGGCSDTKAGNDDDVYFFQHSSPAPDPPGAAGRLTPRQLYLQSGNAVEAHAIPPIEHLIQQPAQKPDKGKRSAATAEAAAERERERLRLRAAQDAEMDRLDSALARHQPGRRVPGGRSAAVDVPGAAAGKAAAATLFTASSPAPESPFGSASSVCTLDPCLALHTPASHETAWSAALHAACHNPWVDSAGELCMQVAVAAERSMLEAGLGQQGSRGGCGLSLSTPCAVLRAGRRGAAAQREPAAHGQRGRVGQRGAAAAVAPGALAQRRGRQQ